MAWTIAELERWIDRHAIDVSGHKVGTIADVYVDDATGEPEWLAVMTGLFGTRVSFVPVAGATEVDGDVQLPHEKSKIKGSPNVEADGELSVDEEQSLYQHYGLVYGSTADGNSKSHVDRQPAEFQNSGSASTTAEVSVEMARSRLRRRDDAAVRAMDLSTDDLEEPMDVPGTESR